MHNPRPRLSLALAALAALSVALLGCTFDATDTSAHSPGGAGDTSSPAPDEKPDAAEDETDDEPAAPSAQACLQGTWLADNEFFLTAMREISKEMTGVTGEVTLVFGEDGTVTTTYTAWQITAMVEGIESVITRDGVDLGTYTADESRVSIEDTHVGSVLNVRAGTMAMPVTPDPVRYVEAAYTCDASAAAITTVDGVMKMSRLGG